MSAHSLQAGRMAAGDRREQLLDATGAVVAERGFHEVSIEAVAARAGISRPIVYHHFGDLPGLLAALVDRQEKRAVAQLAAALPVEAAGSDGGESLLAALGAYLEAVDADPDTWRLVLMPPEGAPQILRERIAEVRAGVVAHLADLVRPGFGAGLTSPDPELTAWTLSALADEAARLMLRDPQRYPAARLLDHARWLLGTMRPAPGA